MKQLIIIFLFAVLIHPLHIAEARKRNNGIDFRQEMRNLVILISKRARKIKPDFIVVPQNAMELITYNGKSNGRIVQSYLDSINGVGCEELFYGNVKDGVRNSADTTNYFLSYLLVLIQCYIVLAFF